MSIVEPGHLDIGMPEVTSGFREPGDIRNAAGNDSLLLELIETPAFQRLKEIRFLGAIDYRWIPKPNGKSRSIRYTRYQHSLGVMQLARLYCSRRDLHPNEHRLVCAAALLHDIGHPPLSHSMEPAFKEKFGIEHHGATEDIIHGRVSIGKDVFSALRGHGMDVEKVIAVISGEHSGFEGFFDGPINFDTIEGILRSCAYMHRASTAPSPDAVMEAAIERKNQNDRNIVDRFWWQKGWVYKNIINSREGVLSDFACRLFFRRNSKHIDIECFFGTETGIFRKLPGLRELLTSKTFDDDIVRIIDEPVIFRDRDYYVDQNGDFFSRRDDVRYRHSRSDRVLALEKTLGITATRTAIEQQGAFFDDDAL